MQDLAAGRIDLVLESALQLPFTRAGNIKAYAVTSDARLAQAPDIPTISEMGLPAVSHSTWVTAGLNLAAQATHPAMALVTLASSSPPRAEPTDAKIRPGNPAPAIGPGTSGGELKTKRVSDSPVSTGDAERCTLAIDGSLVRPRSEARPSRPAFVD